MVVAQHGLITTGESEIDVSYLADTVLMFRYFEAGGEIHQALSVFKKRTGPHQRSLRQLKITAGGIAIGEPLTGFRGVMTGTPEYDGQTALLGDTPRPAPGGGG
jgi:circadian clock protein KaiC